jgi:hypothetical protein
MTLQTAAEHKSIEKRNRKIPLKDTARWQIDSKGQSEELLSYNLLTDIGLHMDEVNGLHHSIFYSIAKDIMNWPFFLAFVASIMMRMKMGMQSIIE